MEEAKPTKVELVEIQLSILPLLHASHNQIVNFGISLLKNSYEEQNFDTASFLDWVAPVMMRDDCKGSLKTLLTMFEKIAKKSPELIPQIMDLSADTFAINDLTIQEKAGKLIQKYAQTDNEEIKEKLALYAPMMLGGVANSLSNLIETKSVEENITPEQEYVFAPKKFTFLSEKKRVKIPQNWQELFNAIGDSIHSVNIGEIEMVLNGLVMLQDQIPQDYQQQCDPYLKLLQKTHFESAFKNFVKDFLIRWIKNDRIYVKSVEWYINYIPETITLQMERLMHIQNKIYTINTSLPCLSLPTHSFAFIEPKVLVERLIAYQNAKEEINHLDLSIAIARTPRERVEEAIPLCEQIKDEKLRNLMLYNFGAMKDLSLGFNKTFSFNFFGKNITPFNENSLDMLWAVSARTHHPNDIFLEFENTSFGVYANVCQPFNEKPYFKTESVNGYDNKNYTSIKLIYVLPQQTDINTLIYSQNYGRRQFDDYTQKDDILFWQGLTPIYTNSIYTYLLHYKIRTSENNSDAIEGGLKIMLNNHFVFSDAAYYFLGASCINKKSEHRGLAAEVLILHFQNQTIEPEKLGDKLGFLFINGYAPVARLFDVINLVKDVSPLHNQALTLMLDALLIHFKNTSDFPTNFKKLLEVYFDLLSRTNKKPSDETKQMMESWQKNNSLKNITKQIINLS